MSRKDEEIMDGTLNEEINSEAVVDEKKAAQEAKKQARNEAKTRVRKYIKELDDCELKSDLTLLIGTGSRASAGATRVSINGVLRDAFIANGEISEMDLFLQFKIGRPEMTTKIRIFLKAANADDRIWVKFDEAGERYIMVAEGAETPEGWDGFVPAEQNVL